MMVRKITASGLKQTKFGIQQARNMLKRFADTAGTERRALQEVLRMHEEHFRRCLATSANSTVVTSRKIAKFGFGRAKLRLHKIQQILTECGVEIDKPQTLCARENELKSLLASSSEAVLVTSVDRRFVSANQKALNLFGISETNFAMFTLDAFVSRPQVLRFGESGMSFMSRIEKRGRCKIRRLDGNVRVADYIYTANYLPFLHLCRFRNDHKHQVSNPLAA
jgi:PAS domain-containing protein